MPDVTGARTRRSRGATQGHEVVSLWPHPGGVIQVVSVPSFIGTELVGTLSVGFSLDEADRAAIQGADQQRDRVRRRRAGRRRRRCPTRHSARWPALAGTSGVRRVQIGDSEYVAVSRDAAAAAPTGEGATVADGRVPDGASSCDRAPIGCAS